MTAGLQELEWLRRPRWRRRLSALSAVLAAIGFVAMWPPSAQAQQEVDQIVGGGRTASALTVEWENGLLRSDNKTVTPRDPNSPYAFMREDFKDLTVTVSQTTQLVNQAIKVTWSGGLPTVADFQANFLQMMQCYGDEATGPDPEGCQFGSADMLQGGVLNASIGSRAGNQCATSTPSITDPPRTKENTHPGNGCDPSEPRDETHVQPCTSPSGCDGFSYSVPFVPAGTDDRFHGTVTEFYDRFNSNEVQQANTGVDGTGERSFQVLTSVQAPGLGCGFLKQDGTPRDCWLVIVPRGTYNPNGWKVDGSTTPLGYVQGSPLSAATWAQRIQIHLSFNNVPSNCAIGSAKERPLIGTELAARAVFSWQIALNAAANCKTIFGYAATPEPVNTLQLASDQGAGLAFTTIPIGSEVTRSGGEIPTGPPVVYAPLTTSAIMFPFHINQASGLVTTPIKLTPRLMAKSLTQSYRFDLPDVDPSSPGPDWASGNPNTIIEDPEFQRLNRDITRPATSVPRAPLVNKDHSAVNQQVWKWVIADPAARAWLAGTADEHGMKINPNYVELGLGEKALDSYPRADPTCFLPPNSPARVPRCTLDKLPYQNNLGETAAKIRTANNPLGADWDPGKLAPDGQSGWWGNGGIEPAGRIFLWGVASSTDVANLGLVPAELCKADGTGCVAPTAASVATALSSAKRDSAGLLQIDPAAAGAGGYPLVAVTYAAVRTTLPADALRDYASLILYASSRGQSPGVAPGELPRGYLPLPAALRTEAQAAAQKLMELVFPQPPREAASPAAPPPQVTRPPSPSPTIVAQGPAYTTKTLTPVNEQFTPNTPLGLIRWTLLAVIVVGALGAVGGPVVRFIGRRLALRRWRT